MAFEVSVISEGLIVSLSPTTYIPGATKTEHALQNTGAMTLRLSGEEMAKIDDISRMVTS